MQMEKLDKIADDLADMISAGTSSAAESEEAMGNVFIPVGEFRDVAKARNEQAKQDNEQLHWEIEWKKAELDAATKQKEVELELKKLEQALEIEKLRAENEKAIAEMKALNDQQVAETRAEAEKEAAEINKAASDTRSKRDLIGRVLDFIGKVLVAILGLGACIYQASTILREEEDGNYVNTRSTNFWHKPRT